MVGVYSGDPALKQGKLHGGDFSLRGPPFLIGEFGLRENYGKDAEGLSSNLKVGGYSDDGLYGFYLVGDQRAASLGRLAKGPPSGGGCRGHRYPRLARQRDAPLLRRWPRALRS